MSARVLLHKTLPRRLPMGDVVRRFGSLGYMLSNTRAGNIEARPMRRSSVVEAYFAFGRRPQ